MRVRKREVKIGNVTIGGATPPPGHNTLKTPGGGSQVYGRQTRKRGW